MTDTRFLEDFYRLRDGQLVVTPEQGSDFAKTLAGDFNPIHDADNRRFCVPGDLLFALVLDTYGASADMLFRFTGMVGGNVPLVFPENPGAAFAITDESGKSVIEVERSGAVIDEPSAIGSLIRSYVGFSGQNFPHVLVPLMEEHGVMVNPKRPLVMYERMGFHLPEPLAASAGVPEPRLKDAVMTVNGKRGEIRLDYELVIDQSVVADGSKHLVLSGLRAFDAADVERLVADYESWKAAYFNQPAGTRAHA
ncbi:MULTISPECIES: DUF3581 family protein [unclassified Thioalkalivibrio]|uniref:DUF3581 family protein n=1 Tax=unclassified Thioalkalivibrio TaxID=2621013 RepID=UPI000375C611|nr:MULTISPECIES: DUF3581 family protein [unclassified Thioalkalivibrio]